jgi:hypothetical protein
MLQKNRTVPLLDEYFSKDALAGLLGVTPRTLNRWHDERTGPDRIRVGRKVLYSLARWLESRSERGTLR